MSRLVVLLAVSGCELVDPPKHPARDEHPELGLLAGPEADAVVERRLAFDEVDPIEPWNPNLAAAAPGSMPYAQLDDASAQAVFENLHARVTPTDSLARVPWSSAAGVVASYRNVTTDYVSNWPMPEGREECVAPVVMIDCCSYTLTEGNDGSGMSTDYYRPGAVYDNKSEAETAMRLIYAQVPIYLPYTNGNVKLVNGWIYDGSARDAHGSLDYVEDDIDDGEDPSFGVRAAGPGTVVAKYWDAWHGNVVVIEHDDANDFEYRSFYFHLRNGKTNDIAMAKSRTVLKGDDGDPQRQRYINFANLSKHDDLWWGTNDDEILVDVGDHVEAQQLIAHSGNTGPGGAGMGLSDDGTPEDPDTANNHLHFMLAVRHPDVTDGAWMYIDPYGVYEQRSTGCYDLLDNTVFDRMLAPFYPAFHGVDLGVYNAYLYYYGQMGMSPSMLSVQQPGDGAIAAGAFEYGLGTDWYVYDYLKGADYDEYFFDLDDAGYWVPDRSVTIDTSGVARHTSLFRPDPGTGWYTYGKLTLTKYQDTFDDLVDNDGWDLVDFFGYNDGTDRVAATFAPQSGGFIHQGLLNSDDFTESTNDYADDGWLPVDVNLEEYSDGTWLSALYRETGDGRMVHWGMDSDEYQQWFDFYAQDGWHLESVQNYDEGDLYAAIWAH